MTAQYWRFFRWHVFRHLRRHPLLAALNILSVALGVAVYLAIQIANYSANRAFAASIDMVAGKAELEVTVPSGAIPEDVFPLIVAVPGVAAATPLVRGLVVLPDFPGEYLDLLGIDIFTDGPFRTFEPEDFGSETFDIERWLVGPTTIALTDEFLTTHHLRGGDKMRARVGPEDRELEIGFALRSDAAFDPHFGAIDIGWAQEIFGSRGKLGTIHLRLKDPSHQERVVAELRKILPHDASVAAPARRTEEVGKMLSGFELNLAAMSLLSLIVGMFLIYNTVSASVVRRQHEIGILRSLGMRRSEVRALFLLEAIVLGAIGCFLGLGGGVLVARFLMGTVTETISSIYVLINAREVAVDSGNLVSAWVIGMIAVVISGWFPAQVAAEMEPVRALRRATAPEESTYRSAAWPLVAVVSIVVAILFSLLALSSGPRWLAFLAAFFVLAGFSCLVPWLVTVFSRSARRVFHLMRRRCKKTIIEAELAAANLSRALGRNSVTIAALAVAVAMTVGVSVMVYSFRKTVERWIKQTLVADLFIAPTSNEVIGASSFMSTAALEFLVNHPAVEAADPYREVDLRMGEEKVAVTVLGGERRQFQFLAGDNRDAMHSFRTEASVLISESFARRHHLRTGEAINLTAPEGVQTFPIAGVVHDYSRDQGVIYMSRRNFSRLWHDDRVNSVAVYLRKGHSSDELTNTFRKQFSAGDQFAIYSNRSLRARIFEIFDQTFAVTYVLRTIAVCVAVTGVLLSLTTLITERSRELAIIRALGGSRGQIGRLLLWETAMLGVLAGLIGLTSGLCLSLVLTGVINRAFFGWTIQLAFPWRSLALTPIWIFAAALIAAVVPAWRAGHLVLTDSLRME